MSEGKKMRSLASHQIYPQETGPKYIETILRVLGWIWQCLRVQFFLVKLRGVRVYVLREYERTLLGDKIHRNAQVNRTGLRWTVEGTRNGTQAQLST